jgi:hypothetical protein
VVCSFDPKNALCCVIFRGICCGICCGIYCWIFGHVLVAFGLFSVLLSGCFLVACCLKWLVCSNECSLLWHKFGILGGICY